MINASRRAGVSVPLFSLRSTRSWGIGEIGDIPFFSKWLIGAAQGALQILPLNELSPGETSPYSALSAMAIDPQFISVWMMDDAEEIESGIGSELARLRATTRIEYRAVREIKARALRAAFQRFLTREWATSGLRAASLRAYIESQAWWLGEYSLYRALRAKFNERPWMEWPQSLRDRDAAALATARADLAEAILFYQYVQWVADAQWRSVRRICGEIEILGDFPFMVALDSADVWSRRGDFLLDASVGTPPDAFSETGQEWGLPPYNWDAAAARGFEWLRARARRQADLYDGFRVDHLVGFYRTYVRPLDGRAPYFMPSDERAQTALGESVMRIMIETGADVSVEDLGTVPPFVRASIARLNLPGYKVLRWEPDEPRLYPPRSVAMTGTHDTETLADWWPSASPDDRSRLGFSSPAFDDVVRDGVLERMYGAGSNLVLVPIQDIFGWRNRINHPATISDANWTYVLPWPVDRMTEQPEAAERSNRLTEWAYRLGRRQPAAEHDD